jgi:hypothetical protein
MEVKNCHRMGVKKNMKRGRAGESKKRKRDKKE